MKLRKHVWGLVAVALAAGCGATGTAAPAIDPPTQARPITDVGSGYSLVLPAGWYRARRNLTPQLLDPREILSIGTYPLRYVRRTTCRIPGCPTPALNGFGATDILMSIQERVRAPTMTEDVAIDLKPRQTRVGGPGSCTRGRVAWYVFDAFSEAGRSFYLLVVMGERAPARARRDLRRVLDSLRFSPRVPPT